MHEQSKEIIGQKTISFKNGGGIMGIPLPQSFPPFAIGKTYSWQFFLLCNQSDRFAVNGVVRRVAITHDMKKELQGRKTLQQKIITYRKYGLMP
ncbi:hypothetical protein RintRC_7289 [Richelia intracellularis]|nr:hypothetical protein RintRC_7289 [Richelia intracellularis]